MTRSPSDWLCCSYIDFWFFSCLCRPLWPRQEKHRLQWKLFDSPFLIDVVPRASFSRARSFLIMPHPFFLVLFFCIRRLHWETSAICYNKKGVYIACFEVSIHAFHSWKAWWSWVQETAVDVAALLWFPAKENRYFRWSLTLSSVLVLDLEAQFLSLWVGSATLCLKGGGRGRGGYEMCVNKKSLKHM